MTYAPSPLFGPDVAPRSSRCWRGIALEEVDSRLARTVAAYRAGFLPEERRLLEQRLHHQATCAALQPLVPLS